MTDSASGDSKSRKQFSPIVVFGGGFLLFSISIAVIDLSRQEGSVIRDVHDALESSEKGTPTEPPTLPLPPYLASRRDQLNADIHAHIMAKYMCIDERSKSEKWLKDRKTTTAQLVRATKAIAEWNLREQTCDAEITLCQQELSQLEAGVDTLAQQKSFARHNP